MEDFLVRSFHQLIERPNGPFHIRFVLQPCMAIFFAIRGGIRDARQDRPPFLWALFSQGGLRRGLLRSGWEDIGRVFMISVILDAVYQLIEFRWLYPLQAVITGIALAIVPYVLLRGPAARIARWARQRPLAHRRRMAG